MSIHIDASRALDVQPTGVNVYAREIIEHLPLTLPGAEIILYAPEWLRSRAPEVFPELPVNCRWKFLRWPPKFLWTQIRLCISWRVASWKKGEHVFFAPAHVAPFFSPCGTVITIHDIAFDVLPQAYSWHERLFARILTRRTARRARVIFSPSEETKQQLVLRYSIPAQKIIVTPLALPCGVRVRAGADEISRVRLKYGITRPFLLTIGRVEYKKGTDIVLGVFEKLRRTGHDIDLVLVGKPGVGYGAIRAQIEASPARAWIRELGFTPENDSAALYSMASTYVVASRYEGFGINILEAFWHAAPVVALRAGSTAEVAGDGAALAHDAAELEAAIDRVLTDPVERAALIQRGSARAADFSWEKTIGLMRPTFL